MRIDHVLVKLSLLLTCLILLVSCASPTAVMLTSPGATLPSSIPTDPLKTKGATPQAGTPISPVIKTLQFTASPQASPSPQAALVTPTETLPTPVPYLRTHYVLDAVFDFYQHTLSVTETIHYVNDAPDSLSDLVLLVEPNLWMGGFSLFSLTWENGEAIDNYSLDADQMQIPLPEPLASGAALLLNIEYSLLLPQIPPPTTYRPQPYGYTTRQTNIVDWYPYIPPYRSGEGWLVHADAGFGEHLVFDEADFDVTLTLADPVEDLVVAASAPATQQGDTYSYHLEDARTFALSAGNEYQVLTTRVGDVEVYSYFFPWDKASGEEVLQNTADALELYSRLIMPYPHATLSAVEADFFDGMEYEGLFFLSHGFYDLYDGTPKGYLTFIAAHETAHQWWYGLVGNDQALEPWLDEALCTYMERLFYEYVYPDYATEAGQSILDYWWFYRVNFYDPHGAVDGTVYDFYDFITYRNAVYLNGARFLERLRNLIGDDAFFSFLRQYADQEKYRIATTADFFTILRQNTSVDIDGLVEQFFQVAR